MERIASRADPQPGLLVADRFKLVKLLKAGGMGSVWHARHIGLDQACAVKFMHAEVAQHLELRRRFEREAKTAARLRSPHVVRMLDYGIWEGLPYIAMEFLEGEDLCSRLERVGRLSFPVLCDLMRELCGALKEAHEIGIVHRDLKPDNIFMCRNVGDEVSKLIDFGIVRAVSPSLVGGIPTTHGTVIGTPPYMSPEQIQGLSIDHRTDLWSLAIICFEALIGRRPFDGNFAQCRMQIAYDASPMPVPSQCGAVPRGFDAWWLKAAARDPARRFQRAEDFLDSFTQLGSQPQPNPENNFGSAAYRPTERLGDISKNWTTAQQIIRTHCNKEGPRKPYPHIFILAFEPALQPAFEAEHREIVALLEPLAQAGHLPAILSLSRPRFHSNSNGTSQWPLGVEVRCICLGTWSFTERTVYWALQGVALNQAQACMWLATFCETANQTILNDPPDVYRKILLSAGVSPTMDEAQRWLRRAVELGEVRGLYRLAWIAQDKKDFATAFSIWVEAATLGDSSAQVVVSERYAKGLGVAQNRPAALKWLQKAAAQGHRGAVACLQDPEKFLAGLETIKS